MPQTRNPGSTTYVSYIMPQLDVSRVRSHWAIAIATSNFLWCLLSLNVNSSIEINGTHFCRCCYCNRNCSVGTKWFRIKLCAPRTTTVKEGQRKDTIQLFIELIDNTLFQSPDVVHPFPSLPSSTSTAGMPAYTEISPTPATACCHCSCNAATTHLQPLFIM